MRGQKGKYAKLGNHIAQKTSEKLNEVRVRLKPHKMTLSELGDELDIDNTNARRVLLGEHTINMKQFIEVCMVFRLDPVEVFEEIWKKEGKKKFK